MQRQNNCNTVLDVNGDMFLVFPLISLKKLSPTIFASTLTTCKINFYPNSFFGRDTHGEDDKGWSFFQANEFLKKIYGINFNVDILKKAMTQQLFPLQIIEMISSKNKMLTINFIGYGDSDGVGISYSSKDDLGFSFTKGTMFEETYKELKKVEVMVENEKKQIVSLLDNGSCRKCRHGLRSEKNIIMNMVRFFSENLPYKMEQLDMDKVEFIFPFIFFDEENKEENINAVLMFSMFEKILPSFDILGVLRKFDSAEFDFAETDKNEFILYLQEFLLKEMNQYFLPFNIDSEIYALINFDDEHAPILNEQFGPLHFIQAVLATCMIQNLNDSVKVRETIFSNILDVIRELQQNSIDWGIVKNPIDFLIKRICGENCELETIKESVLVLNAMLAGSDNVTQFNFVQFDEDRKLSDGFMLEDSGVFVVPLQKMYEIFGLDDYSQRFISDCSVHTKFVAQFSKFDFSGLLQSQVNLPQTNLVYQAGQPIQQQNQQIQQQNQQSYFNLMQIGIQMYQQNPQAATQLLQLGMQIQSQQNQFQPQQEQGDHNQQQK